MITMTQVRNDRWARVAHLAGPEMKHERMMRLGMLAVLMARPPKREAPRAKPPVIRRQVMDA